jgi:hypothetical protein
MKKTFVACCMALTGLVHAQQFDFNPQQYTFNDKALSAPLMDSTGYHTCLHWDHRYSYIAAVNDQLQKVELTHTLRQINDVRSLETYNKLYLPIYSTQQVVNVKVRVIHQGKVVYEADAEDIKSVEEEGVQYQLLAIEQMSIGCYVETIIGLLVNVDFQGSKSFQTDAPIKDALVCLISPGKVKFKCKVYNSDVVMKDTLTGDERYTFLKATNVPALQEEEYCFTDAYRMRMEYCLLSVDGDIRTQKFADMGMRFYENSFSNFEKSKSGIKKMLKDIAVSSDMTEAEKIFVIEDYLKRNVQKEDNVETEDIATVALKKKYSSPFGLNRLYMFAFKEAGVIFEVVGTCDRTEKLFDKTFESASFFENVLFYFPGIDAFLDPSNDGVRSPIIGEEFLGQDGLRIKTMEIGGVESAVTTIKKIPYNNLEGSIYKEDYAVSFTSDMSQTVTSYFKSYSGYAQPGLRSLAYYTNDEQREEFFKELITGNHKNAKVDDLKLTNYDLSKREQTLLPFETAATITGPDLIEYAGDKIILKIGEVIGQQAQMYDEKPRQNPIDVGTNHEYRRELRLDIPDGYKLNGLEALQRKVECKDEAGLVMGFFTSSYSMQGNQLEIRIMESYSKPNIEKRYYPSFRELINAAADFNKVTITIEKKV